jgi:hypothetical protein
MPTSAGSVSELGLLQWWQVHTWLQDFQLAGGMGLKGTLTQQQLQQCKAARDQQLEAILARPASSFQRSVYAAVQKLPVSWEQRPRMEQLSVGRDGVTPDGALLLDMAGKTADSVLVAVEADGPTHFRQPDRGLTGPTQYRNRALAARGYKVVSVPFFEWQGLKGAAKRQQYQLRKFRKAGVFQTK